MYGIIFSLLSVVYSERTTTNKTGMFKKENRKAAKIRMWRICF